MRDGCFSLGTPVGDVGMLSGSGEASAQGRAEAAHREGEGEATAARTEELPLQPVQGGGEAAALTSGLGGVPGAAPAVPGATARRRGARRREGREGRPRGLLGRRQRSRTHSGGHTGSRSLGSGGAASSLAQQVLRPPVAEPVPAIREPVGAKSKATSGSSGVPPAGSCSEVVSLPAFKMVFNTALGGLVGEVLFGMMKVSFTLPLREKVVSIAAIQGCDPASFGATGSDLTAVNVLAKAGAMEVALTALKDRLGGTVRVDVSGKEFLLIMAALQWA